MKKENNVFYLGIELWTPLSYHFYSNSLNKEQPIFKRVLPWYRDQSGRVHMYPTELFGYIQ